MTESEPHQPSSATEFATNPEMVLSASYAIKKSVEDAMEYILETGHLTDVTRADGTTYQAVNLIVPREQTPSYIRLHHINENETMALIMESAFVGEDGALVKDVNRVRRYILDHTDPDNPSLLIRPFSEYALQKKYPDTPGPELWMRKLTHEEVSGEERNATEYEASLLLADLVEAKPDPEEISG